MIDLDTSTLMLSRSDWSCCATEKTVLPQNVQGGQIKVKGKL
jgi:hypothetical protein